MDKRPPVYRRPTEDLLWTKDLLKVLYEQKTTWRRSVDRRSTEGLLYVEYLLKVFYNKKIWMSPLGRGPPPEKRTAMGNSDNTSKNLPYIRKLG